MYTPQYIPRHRDRIGRLAAGLITLAAIGLALLILVPSGGRKRIASGPNTAVRTPTRATLTTVVTTPPAGCFRDPLTHALLCARTVSAPIASRAPARYFAIRSPTCFCRSHEHLTLPAAVDPAILTVGSFHSDCGDSRSRSRAAGNVSTTAARTRRRQPELADPAFTGRSLGAARTSRRACPGEKHSLMVIVGALVSATPVVAPAQVRARYPYTMVDRGV